MIEPFEWPAVDQFIGRTAELEHLQNWWDTPSPHAQGLNLFGRRRVGKSWLFRRFAHGKPAVLLVAQETTPAKQMVKLAEQLSPYVGVTPAIGDLGDLFQILFGLAQSEQALVVIDEFPYLLGSSSREQSRSLSTIQASIEQHRDRSRLKLMLCGSAVTQMENLQSTKSPLHGRFDAFELRPMPFAEAKHFFEGDDTLDSYNRFSIAGGIPKYLRALSRRGLETAIATSIVDANSPLFNEPLSVLRAELREPSVYLAILEALAQRPADLGKISALAGLPSKELSPYLNSLKAMRLVRDRLPIGAKSGARTTQWECADHFMRFWFRFVGPYRSDLESGAIATQHVHHHVMPKLAEHVSIVFEDDMRRWLRQQYPEAGKVGAWWGNALSAERRAGRRETEEIDAVGLSGRLVKVAGEAKWMNKPASKDVLDDLRIYKLPAISQAKLDVPEDHRLVIASRGGFTMGLQTEAESAPNVKLIDAKAMLETLQ